MSVLKVKDNGVWKDVPSIKGETGDAAGFGTATASVDTGTGTPSCVVTLSGDDTAKNFDFAFHNLMYDDSDLQSDFADLADDFDVLQGQFDTAVAALTVDSEVADIRVGDDGVTYTSAGAAVRGQFHDVKSALGYFEKESIDILSKLGGGITRATVLNGTIANPSNDHLVHTNHCPVIAGSYAQIINNKPLQSEGNYYKYAWQIFDSGHNYIGGRDLDTGTREGKFLIPSNGAYIAYDIGEYDSSNNYDGIRQTDFSSYDVGIKVYTEENLFNAVDAIGKDADLTWHSDGINGSVYEWENKRINAVDGSIVDSTNRLKIKDPIPKYIDNISFVGYECGLFAYRADGTFVGWWNGSTWKINNLDWIVNSITIPKGQSDDDYDMYIVLRKPSNVDISSNDANDFSFFTKYNYLNKRISDIENDVVGVNYAITADMLKKNVNVTKLGTLTYHQSFLKYNDKYYSTDGDNIAVQDASFNLENTVALNVEHGNAFCLGSSNLGYVSGWDDNNVYVIDLDTLTLVDTISLPTTGYTTCAVDDINSLIYIFQRNSYPDTKAIYNLIVYDYQNEQIISTNKVPVEMAAMQACDIYHGRIIVLYGGGVSAKPNGYIVCDTNGNVIGEYVLGSFSSLEPEGVFFDRDTHDLMFSFIDKMLYKIY